MASVRTVMIGTAVAACTAGSSLLAGCGGEEPENEAPISAVVRSEQMDALNLAVVTDDGETGTLVGTLVNQASGTDAPVGVSVETEDGPAEAVLLDGTVELPQDEDVRLAVDQRVGLEGNLPKGRFIEVTLDFESSASLTTQVPVEPPTGPYEEVEVPAAAEVEAG